MQQLSFIHVSDLHLDNFPPVKQENDEMAIRLHDAPYGALKNLLELCRQKSPQFIVYSGDIHEHGLLSLEARFCLTDFFNELKTLDIPFSKILKMFSAFPKTGRIFLIPLVKKKIRRTKRTDARPYAAYTASATAPARN